MSSRNNAANILRLSVAAIRAVMGCCTQARADISLSLTPVGGSAVGAGSVVPIQVFLDGPTTSTIAGLQFDSRPSPAEAARR